MATLTASRKIIVIRNDLGESSSSTTIIYEKAYSDELWQKKPGEDWEQVEDFSALGVVSPFDPEEGGSYTLQIGIGEIYEAGVFREGLGPLTDPQQLAGVKVFGVAKQPKKTEFIGENSDEPGGTFNKKFIQTSENTTIAIIGCKRGAFDLDADGIPIFDDAEGVTSQEHHPSTGNVVISHPLLPGNDYECQAVVVDSFGNWQVLKSNFRTLSRKITVQFKQLNIVNDSDPGGDGEAQFLFGVFFGTQSQPRKIEEFHLPETRVRDGRSYPLGFAHIGNFVSVAEDERNIFVRTIGNEDDSPDSDEQAWSIGGIIEFPTGGSFETVNNRRFKVAASPSTKGSDFRYNVDVVWSVEYQ